MQIAIISSSKDPAGVNIRNNLIELFSFKKTSETFGNNEVFEYTEIPDKKIRLYLINDDLVHSENIDRKIDADFFIFASKHRSKENTPSFTVHSIGNFGAAYLGGGKKTLCPSSAILFKNLFVELNKNAKDSGYEITMEATHHGPYVEKPAVFVEIGSTEKEWDEKKNGEIIAKTIMDGIKNENKSYKIAAGIGGTHYCCNFNKIMLNTDIAYSFICPKYSLENLDEDIINQIISKTKEKIDFFILDWKGMGKEKARIVETLGEMGIKMERADKIRL
jgi:D-aminoacyl-tRNA deacylase